MTHIVIYVNDVATEPDTGNALYKCKYRCSGMTASSGDELIEVPVAMSALATTVNASILATAIAQCENNGWGTVGALDKKTLVGGAVGL